MKKEQEIEKARQKKVFNIGDTFTRHGITYKCTGFSANTGKPLWSKVKDGESGKQAPTQQPTKKTQSQASDDGGSKQDTAPKQEKAPYDAPTPKVEYKTKRPADGVEFRVPAEWNAKNPSSDKKYSMKLVYNLDMTEVKDVSTDNSFSPPVSTTVTTRRIAWHIQDIGCRFPASDHLPQRYLCIVIVSIY